MGVDLTARLNREQWESALAICGKAVIRNDLDDVKSRFVLQMTEEWEMNGAMMEPTLKQFNWLRQIAFDLQKEGYR